MLMTNDYKLVLEDVGTIKISGSNVRIRRGDTNQPCSDDSAFITLKDGDVFQSIDGDKTWASLQDLNGIADVEIVLND